MTAPAVEREAIVEPQVGPSSNVSTPSPGCAEQVCRVSELVTLGLRVCAWSGSRDLGSFDRL